ncbi:transcriptional regulator [Thiohalobacter thiocyanaticus]|uniref:Transcriptional regulator n=2 Tax=Thiohalobacter TaxID=1273155 RepID=A0A1Z4VNW6_9GAMM|nr:transcriptional regulator [Thiohalobacter thiocyanaticus]
MNATLGFERLAVETGKSTKSLQRMLGASGNPTAENLNAILKVLQECEEVQFRIRIDGTAA